LKKAFRQPEPSKTAVFLEVDSSENGLFNRLLNSFDDLVSALDKFDAIRYPDKLLEHGAIISIGWGTPVPPSLNPPKPPRYELSIPALDAFIARLFTLLLNPVGHMIGMNKEAVRALETDNACCKGWFTDIQRT
jgi:hypothetical protein